MKKIFIICAFMASIVSCTDLNVEPDSLLTDETIYKEKDEFLNGLSGVNNTLGVWSELIYKAGVAADDMIMPARGADWKGDLQEVQTHEWTVNNGELSTLYTSVSKIISVSNSYIDAIDNSNFATDTDVLIMKDEARFVRAFAYFLMMDYWGNVPLVTTSTYDSQNPPTQNTRTELYNFVESELIELSNSLPESVEYGHYDRYAAKTLLAKLYLNAEVYLGQGNAQWEKVVELTEDIMKNSNYILENDFKDVFKWDNYNSKEIIFAMICDSQNTYPENISYLFSLTDMREKYGSFAAGWGGSAALPSLIHSYDENDIRLQAFLFGPQVNSDGEPLMAQDDKGVTRQLEYYVDFTSSDPVYNADHWDGARGVKYLMDGIGGTMVERGLNNDMPILRYADVLMMRAEALFRINPNDTEALNLVNQVRTRNGNNPIPEFTELTEENLLAERGREFAWEGWRRNDQIRFGTWGDAWDYKEESEAYRELFPIPQIQIDSNPNLKQNEGY